jgi:hypothetical protein
MVGLLHDVCSLIVPSAAALAVVDRRLVASRARDASLQIMW